MPRLLSALLLHLALPVALHLNLLPAAELRRGPFLQVQAPDSITLRWRTDPSVQYSSVVRYGTSMDDLKESAAAKELATGVAGVKEWQATLTKLEPDTKYYYAVEADRATLCGADEQHWFRTAPKPGAERKLRFWCIGDSGSNRPRNDALDKVLKETAPMDPILIRNGFRKFNKGHDLDGIVLLGDNAYPRGTDEQYQAALFNVYTDELRHTPLWPCVGNHDIDDAYKHTFTTNTEGVAGGTASKNMLYYSADIGRVHLIVLDPWKSWMQKTTDEKHAPWLAQLAWLKKDLAANKLPWVIVVEHFPPYCDGNYNSDSNKPLAKLREQLIPIFDEYGVDVCLTGHDHTYQRSYLLRGHTGDSKSFDKQKHLASDSDGKKEPIVKKPGANGGTIYIVAGAAGGSRPNGSFSHPAMVALSGEKEKNRGLGIPSTLVLELDGDVLKGWQVDVKGNPIDEFVLKKSAK